MRVRFCPNCGSSDIFAPVGFETGMIYKCKNCGFQGTIFPEKEMKLKEKPEKKRR